MNTIIDYEEDQETPWVVSIPGEFHVYYDGATITSEAECTKEEYATLTEALEKHPSASLGLLARHELETWEEHAIQNSLRAPDYEKTVLRGQPA